MPRQSQLPPCFQPTHPCWRTAPLPPPTDQPPPEVPLPDPIPLGPGFLISGALDARTRTANTGRQGGIWINTAELDIQHNITRDNTAQGNVFVQVLSENPPDVARGRDIQIGEAYVTYRLPVEADFNSTAYVKAGQFQIPFGLLAVYDPHLLILQPLYAQSLGLRTDFGLAVSGRLYGYLNYDFSVTTGTGPNHIDVNPNRVVCFRLGPDVYNAQRRGQCRRFAAARPASGNGFNRR